MTYEELMIELKKLGVVSYFPGTDHTVPYEKVLEEIKRVLNLKLYKVEIPENYNNKTLEAWCKENCQGVVSVEDTNTFIFNNLADATLFSQKFLGTQEGIELV